MPTKKTTRKVATSFEVVQMSLLPDVVDVLETKIIKKEDMWGELVALTAEGYTITMSYDGEREQCTVKLTGLYADMINGGKILYGNGADWEHAAASVWGKHFLLSEGSQWVGTGNASQKMS